MREWGMGSRDGDRCVEALVARVLRQFTEGIQWIHRVYPGVLDPDVRERVCREMAVRLPDGFKPYVPKPPREEWTKQ